MVTSYFDSHVEAVAEWSREYAFWRDSRVAELGGVVGRQEEIVRWTLQKMQDVFPFGVMREGKDVSAHLHDGRTVVFQAKQERMKAPSSPRPVYRTPSPSEVLCLDDDPTEKPALPEEIDITSSTSSSGASSQRKSPSPSTSHITAAVTGTSGTATVEATSQGGEVEVSVAAEEEEEGRGGGGGGGQDAGQRVLGREGGGEEGQIERRRRVGNNKIL